jgi:AMP-binding enzyme
MISEVVVTMLACARRRGAAHRHRVRDAGRARCLLRRPAGRQRAGLPGGADAGGASAVHSVLVRFDGEPKGILHTTGGYLAGVAATHRDVFDLRPDSDVYWCTADVGWVTGHSYIVYGPLANGWTSVMFEGAPDYPDKDVWWEIVERYG